MANAGQAQVKLTIPMAKLRMINVTMDSEDTGHKTSTRLLVLLVQVLVTTNLLLLLAAITRDPARILKIRTRSQLHQVMMVHLSSVHAVVALSTAPLLRRESRPKNLPTPTGPKRVLLPTLRFGARRFTISASSMLST